MCVLAMLVLKGAKLVSHLVRDGTSVRGASVEAISDSIGSYLWHSPVM